LQRDTGSRHVWRSLELLFFAEEFAGGSGASGDEPP
jgi:hypothetical protein